MAQRRMFSKEITNSSEFLMMPASAQNLYFHIGMNADDDGFCEIFPVMRMTDSKPDDLRLLHERGFVYVVDSKVCIVKDWHKNNNIRSDRYQRSRYLNDPKFRELYLTLMDEKILDLKIYKDLPLIESGEKSGIPAVSQRYPQVRLGKVSIGKDNNIGQNKFDQPLIDELFNKFWEEYPRKVAKKLAKQKFFTIMKKEKEPEKLLETMINKLNAYKKTKQWKDKKYIPHPATWLNQARWEDEIEPDAESPKVYNF